MQSLRVFLFGGSVRVCCEDRGEIKLQPSGQALLAYLLLHRQRTHRRETLIDLFWGDQREDQARRCLSSTLWRLRCQLEAKLPQGDAYLLITPGGEVGFNQKSHYWLDVAQFEANVDGCLAQPAAAMSCSDASLLEDTLQLCQGELLEHLYDDWALRAREYFRSLYLKALAHLMHYYHSLGALEKSLEFGQRILEIDPLREQVHREVMRLYWEGGQRAMAILQYELCRKTLTAELNIEPMAETQALFTQIATTQSPTQWMPLSSPRPADSLKQAVTDLETAVRQLDAARLQLDRVLQTITPLANHPEYAEQVHRIQTITRYK